MRHEIQLPARFTAARTPLRAAAASVPAGRWGVAVSGGADSVATLRLLARRAHAGGELVLWVIHLDHELRGADSQADSRFVQELAAELGLSFHLARRHDLEACTPNLQGPLEAGMPGLAARMRRLRLEVYRRAVEEHGLSGVILGHHADDVAETLFIRLLRSSPRSATLGLAPLRFDHRVDGVRLLRPMLAVRRERLRRFLEITQCPWREDASNASATQLRNRVRQFLFDRPHLTPALLRLAQCAAAAEAELEAVSPVLDPSPRLQDLAGLTEPVRRRALRRWMVQQGVPEASAGPGALDSLQKVLDAAGPARVDLPGGVRVERRRGRLSKL